MLKPTKTILAIQSLPFAHAMVRRVYHYVLRRVAPGQVATTYFGSRMNVDINDFLQATIFHYGVWEPETSTIFDAVIETGDTVLDIGANVGYFTLLFGKRVGPDGRVIAIEAHPRIAESLSLNLAENGLSNTVVKNVAVAGKSGTVALFDGPKTNSGSTTIMEGRGKGESHLVPASRLMDILADENLEKISVIKMDIEGAEGPVVNDILENLDQFHDRLTMAIEVNIVECEDWHAYFARFLAAGFSAAQLDRNPEWSHLEEFQGVTLRPIDRLKDPVADILFYRKEPRIERLISHD